MKQLIKNYTFNASAKTITLGDFTTNGLVLERLQLVVDTSTNTILYNFADSTVTAASIGGSGNTVITLGSVGSASSGDKLMIVYDCQTGDPTYDTPPLPKNAAQETGGNLATIATNTSGLATSTNQTNGSQQAKITDGTNIANVNAAAGKNGLYVAPNTVTGAAVSSTALYNGAQARTSEQAATSNTYLTGLTSDKVGKLIVLLNANPENFTSGVATATGTSSTLVVAAPGSGLRVYITDIFVVNSGATTVTVNIQNGSSGATVATVIAPSGGGQSANIRTPIASMSTGAAVYFASSGSTTTLSVTVSGYIGA